MKLDNVTKNIQTDNFQIICTLDLDDPSMANENVKERLKEYPKAKAYYGISKSKIDAINKNICFAEPWNILINFSDDFIFTQKGFDNFITEAIQKYFPDGDCFLHFPDGNQNRLATMTIEGRPYYDRFGYVYHPSYKSEWCDNHAQSVAQILGKYKYMGDDVKIMNHLNPFHGYHELMDDLYRKNSTMVSADKDNYFHWLSLNFDL